MGGAKLSATTMALGVVVITFRTICNSGIVMDLFECRTICARSTPDLSM